MSETDSLIELERPNTWIRWVQFPLLLISPSYMLFTWFLYLGAPYSMMSAFNMSFVMVTWISNYSYVEAAISPLCGYVMYRFGARNTLVVSLALNAVSMLMRSFLMADEAYVILTNVAVVFQSVASVTFYGAIQYTCAKTYYNRGAEQAIVATILMTLPVASNSLAMITIPNIIDQPEYLNGTLVNREDMRVQVVTLMRYLAGLGAILAIMCLALLQHRVLHGCLSLRELWSGVKTLCKSKNFWLLTIANSWQITMVYTLYASVIILVGGTLFGLPQEETGLIFGVAFLVTTAQGVIATRLGERYMRYIRAIIVGTCVLGLGGGVWVLCIMKKVAPFSSIALGASSAIMMSGYGSTMTLIVDRACQLAEPIPSEIVTTATQAVYLIMVGSLMFVGGSAPMAAVWLSCLGHVLVLPLVLFSDC